MLKNLRDEPPGKALAISAISEPGWILLISQGGTTSPGWPLLQAHRGRDSYETLELGASAVLLHDSKTQSMWKHPLSDLWPAACVCRDGFTSEIETSWWDQENNWGHSSQMLRDWLTQWGHRCYCSYPLCVGVARAPRLWELPGLLLHTSCPRTHPFTSQTCRWNHGHRKLWKLQLILQNIKVIGGHGGSTICLKHSNECFVLWMYRRYMVGVLFGFGFFKTHHVFSPCHVLSEHTGNCKMLSALWSIMPVHQCTQSILGFTTTEGY